MAEKLILTLESRVPSKLRGAGFMLLWSLSFSMAMAFAKALSPELNSLMILFLRYFFGLVFFSPFVVSAGITGFITSRLILHIVRVVCVGAAMACTYYAYRHLPLALAASIGMTGPLFTTLLSTLLLRERVSLSKWALILFGYLGVIVMIRPHELPISTGVWVECLLIFLPRFQSFV